MVPTKAEKSALPCLLTSLRRLRRDPRRAAEQSQGHRSRSAAGKAERHHRAERQRQVELAFDTIYAEGQRRYVETFSPYTRQFLDRMDKPKVDEIRGIPPAIAIEQANPVKSTRSTVGTMTEINDYLKLLFPRIAQAFCPTCAREIRPETAKSIADECAARARGRNACSMTFGVPVPAEDGARGVLPIPPAAGLSARLARRRSRSRRHAPRKSAGSARACR